MGIFSLIPRVISPVTSQLTTVFQSILSDLQTEAVKPFVKNGLNKSVTSSQTIKKKVILQIKYFICKEKYGAVKKVNSLRKLRSIISFILELWYQHHVVIVEITHKIRASFKTLASKKVASWRLKKYHSNDELSRKVMFFSYHIE